LAAKYRKWLLQPKFKLGFSRQLWKDRMEKFGDKKEVLLTNVSGAFFKHFKLNIYSLKMSKFSIFNVFYYIYFRNTHVWSWRLNHKHNMQNGVYTPPHYTYQCNGKEQQANMFCTLPNIISYEIENLNIDTFHVQANTLKFDFYDTDLSKNTCWL